MKITADFMKDIPSCGYRYLNFRETIVHWYQWEYTDYMFYGDYKRYKYINSKYFDTFKMIYQGFKKEFEEHKKIIPCCYRGIVAYSNDFNILMDKTLADIKKGQIGFNRYYSGSLSKEVSQRYIDVYIDKLKKQREEYGFYNDELIAVSVLFEVHNATVYDLTEYNTENYFVLDDEIILAPSSYNVLDRKLEFVKIDNALMAQNYVVLEALDPKQNH